MDDDATESDTRTLKDVDGVIEGELEGDRVSVGESELDALLNAVLVNVDTNEEVAAMVDDGVTESHAVLEIDADAEREVEIEAVEHGVAEFVRELTTVGEDAAEREASTVDVLFGVEDTDAELLAVVDGVVEADLDVVIDGVSECELVRDAGTDTDSRTLSDTEGVDEEDPGADADAPVDTERAPLEENCAVPETERDPLEDAEIEGDELVLNDRVFVGDVEIDEFAVTLTRGEIEVEDDALLLRTRDAERSGDGDAATEGVSTKDAVLCVDTDTELDAETDLLSAFVGDCADDLDDE